MIAKNNQQDKSTAILKSLNEFFRDLNEKSREKMVQRQISAIKKFTAEAQKKNLYTSWAHIPWPVQFLPVITKFFRDWGKINAVNPALSGFSGLMGMSKIEINNHLNEDFRPRSLFLEKMPKSREILEQIFREKYDEPLKYPVIFKPNIGERGTGVNFAREDQIADFIEKNQFLEKIILEEFIETEKEFCLSWLRCPQTKRIEVIAVTQRVIPRVEPEGHNSLRELIIKKCKSLLVEEKNCNNILNGFSKAELEKPPTKAINVVRIASGKYGTKYSQIKYNSEQKKSLELLVQEMVKNFAGIYAGRFDLKTNSFEDLLEKKCFIVEMNGVAGTPLDIYDDKIDIDEKYEILFNYFSRIFKIADKNIENGEGKNISKLVALKNLAKNFFGNSKTQELPENVWKHLREVIKISLKKRLKSSDLGKFWQKFKD